MQACHRDCLSTLEYSRFSTRNKCVLHLKVPHVRVILSIVKERKRVSHLQSSTKKHDVQ